jgi:hypothetical protein
MRHFENFRGGRSEKTGGIKLQKIKVIKDEEHGQNDIDNHSGQNYNVERF